MSSANHESHVIQCNCGRKGVGLPATLKDSGWAAFTFPVEKKVTWLCPHCAGRQVDVTATQRPTRSRAA